MRLLLGLAQPRTPHVIAAQGEFRVRVGEAHLHQAAALVDRRRRHRGCAGEIAEFRHNGRIGYEFLGDGDRLAGVVLAVFEVEDQLAAANPAALPVDRVEREGEAALPLRAVLRGGAGEWPAYAHSNVVGRKRLAATRQCRDGPGAQQGRATAKPTRPGRAKRFLIHALISELCVSWIIMYCFLASCNPKVYTPSFGISGERILAGVCRLRANEERSMASVRRRFAFI